MYAVEFQAQIKDGVVHIPKKQKDLIRVKIRCHLLSKKRETKITIAKALLLPKVWNFL